MLKILRNAKVKETLLFAIFIVTGIIFCVLPKDSLDVFVLVISIFFIAYGVIFLIGYCTSPRDLRDYSFLLESILTILLGIFLDFFPSMFIIFICLLLIVVSIRKFIYSLAYKKSGEKFWWSQAVVSGIIIALSITIFILCLLKIEQGSLSILLGTMLSLCGAFYILFLYTLQRRFDKFLKEKIDGEQTIN